MSSTIDERIVSMKFNNGGFQKGISDTTAALDALKAKLNFSGATNSLGELDAVGRKFNLDGLSTGVESAIGRFSAFQVAGIAAITTVATAAIGLGKKLYDSMSGGIRAGFSDYNEKLTSVQTIMNATGADIGTVNGYFKQLDTYSDKTIYNLSDMTGAFAKFTNAGVGMDKSVPAIKGIANMVALAGQGAGAAETAMYNLSQSIAGGFLTTPDYRSLNLANVATKEWKQNMIDAAVSAGKLKKTGADAYSIVGGSAGKAFTSASLFADALAEGWASTDVLLGVLGKYGDETTTIGKKAQAAAQNVKSLPMMLDTLRAAVGTGWTDTFENVFGNVEEATVLFTGMTNAIGLLVAESADSRNKLLGDWKALGGRNVLIEGLTNVWTALWKILTPIKKAFQEVFPPKTGQQLYNLTVLFRDFTKLLIITDKQASLIGQTFKLIFNIIKLGVTIVKGVLSVIGALFFALFSGGKNVSSFGDVLGDLFKKLNDLLSNTGWVTAFFEGLGKVVTSPIYALKFFRDAIIEVVQALMGFGTDGLDAAFTRVRERLESLGRFGSALVTFWKGLLDAFKKVATFLQPLTDAFGQMFSDIGNNIRDALKDVSFNDALDIINLGLLGAITLLIRNFFKKGLKIGDDAKGGFLKQLTGISKSISGVFDGLTKTLEVMQQNLKANVLLKIAGAIALLTASVLILSLIDSDKLTKALTAMTIMFIQLGLGLSALDKISASPGVIKLPATAAALILLAIAIDILVIAVSGLGKLSWGELLKGLLGVTLLLQVLVKVVDKMSGKAPVLAATGVALILIAVAIRILVGAVAELGKMSWDQLVKGLLGMTIMILALIKVVDQMGGKAPVMITTAIALILLSTAIRILAEAVKVFALLDLGALVQGVVALGLVLAILSDFSNSVGNTKQLIQAAVAMTILGVAINILSKAIAFLGALSLEQIGKGVIAIALALNVIAAAMKEMPKNMLATAVALGIVGIALNIIANAVAILGGMSVEELAKGLIAVAAVMLILADAANAMKTALPGALAMIIMAGAIAILVPPLALLALLSWDQILHGLVALAGVFLVVGAAALVLAPITPIILLLGIAIALFGGALFAIGAGALLFATALGIIAVVGIAVVPVLMALLTAIISMIPIAIKALADGIVLFVQVITESAPTFLLAFVTLITTLVTAIVTLAPIIINALATLIMLLVDKIVELVPLLVIAGMKLITGILKGIGDNIGKLIGAGSNLIVQFLLGIGRNAGQLANAGAETIVKFLNALGDAINNKSSDFVGAGSKIFRAIIDGVSKAIERGGSDIRYAGKRIGDALLKGAMNALGIASPSKEFYKVGVFSIAGLINSLSDNGTKVNRAGADIGDEAMNGLRDSMSGVSEALSGNVDLSPTIRPVLDMSGVKKDAGLIGDMFGTQKMNVDTAYASASTIAVGQREAQAKMSTSTDAPSGTNVTFKQYNNSPKALSNAEIYRQTKNQLSVVKEELDK